MLQNGGNRRERERERWYLYYAMTAQIPNPHLSISNLLEFKKSVEKLC
jgi:hypothetical protein